MKTRIHAPLVLAAALSLAGCIDNDASVRIFGVCAIKDASCTFNATCDALWIGPPLLLDVNNPAASLIWPIQVDNQRPDNSNDSGSTNTAIAWVERLNLSYTSTTPGVSIPPLTVDITSSPVQSEGASVMTAVLVPVSVASTLGVFGSPAQLTVELRAAGRYGDGSTFETGPFSVQVETCLGCIPYFDDHICDTIDNSVSPPTVTFGKLSGICPQQGQTLVYACE
jgi:hypothetical protein